VIELAVGERSVRVTHPERVYFPAIGATKLDVVRYFLAVGDGILAALRDRPTLLERRPGGVDGEAFFQRRLPRGAPAWVRTARIEHPVADPADQICPTELAVVAWAANLGTLTFHPAPVRMTSLEHPDLLYVDLDPQPGTGFEHAVEVALALRELLEARGLTGRPKTSGGRGVHVVVPVEPGGWDAWQRLRTTLAAELAQRLPGLVTTERLKRDRGARVYVDCGPITIASAYSIRPTPRGRVSMPLAWDELVTADPDDFDITTVPA
jgi:DNA ligase D-like protein (predicted polymerase)